MEPEERLNPFARFANGLLTPGQRRAAALLLLIMAAAAIWRATGRGPTLGDPLPPEGPLNAELLSRIDPNTATAEDWGALPGAGPGMAKRIVDYRAAWAIAHPGEPAFATLKDLDKVPGIGPAVLERLAPYLRLDE